MFIVLFFSLYVPSLRSAPATFLVSLASSFELDDFATLDEDAVDDEAVSFLSLPTTSC